MTRLEACLLLNAIPNIGFFRAAKIVSHFGNAETVFENSVKEWRQVEGLGAGSCYALKQWKDTKAALINKLRCLIRFTLKRYFTEILPIQSCSLFVQTPRLFYFTKEILISTKESL